MEHAIRGPPEDVWELGEASQPYRDWHSLRRCMEHPGGGISVPGRVGSQAVPVRLWWRLQTSQQQSTPSRMLGRRSSSAGAEDEWEDWKQVSEAPRIRFQTAWIP